MAVLAVTACALLSGGTIECWGDNSYGELANGDTTSSSTPVVATELAGATAVSVGDFSALCAFLRRRGGMPRTDSFGELGNGTTTDSPTPVTVNW